MPAFDQPAPPALVCTLTREDLGKSLRLRGRVVSPEGIQGEYRLTITKIGPAGSTNLNQSGRFSTAANVETHVGSATVSLEEGTRFQAQFLIEAAGKTYVCGTPSGAKI
jgi:hypothetical protein